jgi:hypothetical protein
VDLATKTLEVARRKGIYERLECNDLLAMLGGKQSAAFDLLLATDVSLYLGRLDSVVDEVRSILRPGGMFAFSVERLAAADAALPSDLDFRVTDGPRSPERAMGCSVVRPSASMIHTIVINMSFQHGWSPRRIIGRRSARQRGGASDPSRYTDSIPGGIARHPARHSKITDG